MKNINELKSLCNDYLINKKELEKYLNSDLKNDGVYAIKIDIIKKQIDYVDLELENIRKLCGELAYKLFYELYVNKKSISQIEKELGYSKSELYRKLNGWTEVYEHQDTETNKNL